MNTQPRRWTATIVCGDTEVELDATLSDNDLKVDQRKRAMQDARELGIAHGTIHVFKTTKAHGTVKDRSYLFHTMSDGSLCYV